MSTIEIPIREPKRSLITRWNGMLLLGQILMMIARTIFWLAALFASEPRRSRARAARQQVREMDHAAADLKASIKRDPTAAIDGMDALMERFGDEEMRAEHREWRASLDEHIRRVKTPTDILKAHDGDPDAAVTALTHYRDDHPEDHHAWQCLAAALNKAGRDEDAIAAWREAVRLAEAHGERELDGPLARMGMAGVLAKMGRRQEAVAEFRHILENAPDDSDSAIVMAYFGLGDVCRDSGDIAGARLAWRMAGRWDQTGVTRKMVRERMAAL